MSQAKQNADESSDFAAMMILVVCVFFKFFFHRNVAAHSLFVFVVKYIIKKREKRLTPHPAFLRRDLNRYQLAWLIRSLPIVAFEPSNFLNKS